MKNALDPEALERALAQARGDADRLAAELNALCAESEATLNDLLRLVERYREVQEDSAATRARIAAIGASNAWRTLETLRRIKTRFGVARSSAGRSRRRGVPAFVRSAPLGVNVSGYLDTESGMGEAARASIRSLEAAGIPIALNNVASRLRKQDTTYARAFVDDNPHPFNLVHLNADNMGWFADGRGRRYFKSRYTIGYWFWELAAFREEWVPFFDYVDEVWAASDFVREAYAVWSPVPVVRMPLPVVPPSFVPRSRAHFRLPEDATVFLYVFDVSSQTERKNPAGAIEAFRRAGFRHDQAALVLKFTNAEYDREAVRALRARAEGLNVVFLDGYMDRAELWALLAAADCYFSPHRSEGFGLTILEAMSLGKPVIATAYSGNLDFMTTHNSFPLAYRLTTLERDYGPYMRGASWADPDLDDAARLLRSIVDDPAHGRSRGDAARRQLADERSPAATGAVVRARLEAIRRGEPGT
jgi:glycosyltransferase involved in cell wall biosynthesis